MTVHRVLAMIIFEGNSMAGRPGKKRVKVLFVKGANWVGMFIQ